MDEKERLKLLRKKLKLTQNQLGEKLGVKGITIRRYENESKRLPLMLIYALAGLFKVNPDWLRYGKGKMFLEEDISDSEKIEYVQVPYFENGLAAGSYGGAINYEEAPIVLSINPDFLKNVLSVKNFHNLFILNVVGNSMEPTLNPGDLIFVNPIENDYATIITGAIYVILFENECFVKRIEKDPVKKQIRLLSDNKNYQPIEIKNEELDNLTIIGRVVGKFKKL